MKFEDSKKVGDIFEEYILNIIKRKYPEAYIDDIGKAFSDWDIFIPEKKMSIEVKADYKSQITGNLLIEVEMNNKPSALSVTKADYWVIIDGIRIIWIKPIEIYRIIERNNYGRALLTGDGDSKSKFAYLIPTKIFVLDILNRIEKKDAWVDIIDINDKIHYNNFSNYCKSDE